MWQCVSVRVKGRVTDACVSERENSVVVVRHVVEMTGKRKIMDVLISENIYTFVVIYII